MHAVRTAQDSETGRHRESMKDAQHNGHLIPASAGSPGIATFPICKDEVRKHKRRVGREVTWFYRHRACVRKTDSV